jgi:ATP-dependent protease HslVU (ClpYQ) peptidase subunit
MTVIVWDGKTLAADKMVSCGDTLHTTTKVFKHGADIVAFCGTLSKGLALKKWYLDGAKTEEYPKFQDTEDFSVLIVASGGKVNEYLDQPIAISLEDKFSAWGNGREFAIGAMSAGADAVKAVEITSYHCGGCGRGVDSFEAG